jgi:hypothetical protein
MARPRIIAGESLQASFSLSVLEYQAVRVAAENAGKSISQYIRLTVLNELERAKNGKV